MTTSSRLGVSVAILAAQSRARSASGDPSYPTRIGLGGELTSSACTPLRQVGKAVGGVRWIHAHAFTRSGARARAPGVAPMTLAPCLRDFGLSPRARVGARLVLKTQTEEASVMPAGTSYDTGAPTIEVRIYRNDQLMVRELCESEEEVAAVVEQWSDIENIYALVDDLSTRHGPGDILAPDELSMSDERDYSIASATVSSRGTE